MSDTTKGWNFTLLEIIRLQLTSFNCKQIKQLTNDINNFKQLFVINHVTNLLLKFISNSITYNLLFHNRQNEHVDYVVFINYNIKLTVSSNDSTST